jgi:hypothetical protein
MSHDRTALICDERDAQDPSLAQGFDDELLRLISVRRIPERRLGDGVDGRHVGRSFLAYDYVHHANLSRGKRRSQAAPPVGADLDQPSGRTR